MRIGPQSICGCYYVPSVETSNTKKYLPQVDLKAHTTVISTSSRTVLSQTFVNPSSNTDVNGCKYVFPLYDGVSVVGFTCQVDSRIIKGTVKEKTKAKEEYDAAVERGETAGLLEQGATSDVFMISLGNIPAGKQLFVAITFIGELKYDVGADGIRFTIPTRISPRYGQARMNELDSTLSKGGIAITVDIKMPEDSPLHEVRSPSHPIAVTLGRTSASESQPPHLSRASATLSLGTSTLEKDFVLEIIHQDSGKSKALLETHPTIPGQRALMATLILNRPVQQSKPEIIFIADQSASMRGARTKTLVAALPVFLKSLPVGIKFNICYFGSSHSFIFPESQVYDQNSLEKALKSVEGLNGRLGGTETLRAIKASVESRDNEQPLSIILATDGDIQQQQELFDYLNESVAASKKALRVFALGIGNTVSSGLIEGVARAGNGFAQSVGEEEKLDGKVVRMLRGALTPDHGALTVEVQYQEDNDNEDEFVMVERVSDSLRVLGLDEDDWTDAQLGEESAISAKTTATEKKGVELSGGQALYDHLPTVPAPKLMQTPQNIPPLYSFSRTSIYVLISPEAAQGTIKSIILKGSSAEKSFELEVPIEVLSERGGTIHQLAAKKTVTELEEGRGWLVCAKDEKGVFVKEKHSGRFQSMVKSEAVRLGIQYQIAGKFTSFVATETVSEDLSSASTSGALFSAPTRLFDGSASRSSPPKALSGPVSNTPGQIALFSSTTSTHRKMYKLNHTNGMAPRKQALSAAPSRSPFRASRAENAPVDNRGTDPLQIIIALQTFEGYWILDARLLEVVGLSAQHKAPQDVDSQVWATVLAITYLEGKMAGDREAWVMVVEKGREWLKDMNLGEKGSLEEKWTLARQLIMGTD